MINSKKTNNYDTGITNNIAFAFQVVIFVIITAPIASHMIAKAAHKTNMPKGEGYVMDELEGVDNELPEEK